MSPDPTDTIAAVDLLLRDGSLHEALRVINERVEHRFTGVFRFDPPTLRNVALFDSANPDITVGEDAPLRETYCSLVGETEQPFQSEDPGNDPRLAEHPARETTLAYCGAPLRAGESEPPFGTICHFDVVPRPVPPGEIAVLEAVAPAIARHLR